MTVVNQYVTIIEKSQIPIGILGAVFFIVLILSCFYPFKTKEKFDKLEKVFVILMSTIPLAISVKSFCEPICYIKNTYVEYRIEEEYLNNPFVNIHVGGYELVSQDEDIYTFMIKDESGKVINKDEVENFK